MQFKKIPKYAVSFISIMVCLWGGYLIHLIHNSNGKLPTKAGNQAANNLSNLLSGEIFDTRELAITQYRTAECGSRQAYCAKEIALLDGNERRFLVAFQGAGSTWAGGEKKTLVLFEDDLTILDRIDIDDECWMCTPILQQTPTGTIALWLIGRDGDLKIRSVTVSGDQIVVGELRDIPRKDRLVGGRPIGKSIKRSRGELPQLNTSTFWSLCSRTRHETLVLLPDAILRLRSRSVECQLTARCWQGC